MAMQVTGGVFTVLDGGMAHFTLPDGRHVNFTQDGRLIVEAGDSDGYGVYEITLPTLTEARQMSHKASRAVGSSTHGFQIAARYDYA